VRWALYWGFLVKRPCLPQILNARCVQGQNSRTPETSRGISDLELVPSPAQARYRRDPPKPRLPETFTDFVDTHSRYT
jgi:hypothetical protein